jgi:hypothetical protein
VGNANPGQETLLDADSVGLNLALPSHHRASLLEDSAADEGKLEQAPAGRVSRRVSVEEEEVPMAAICRFSRTRRRMTALLSVLLPRAASQ